jgi:hypothetical protein
MAAVIRSFIIHKAFSPMKDKKIIDEMNITGFCAYLKLDFPCNALDSI